MNFENIELKPCPFCGGKAELKVSPTIEQTYDAKAKALVNCLALIKMSYHIKCSRCYVCQPKYYHTDIVLRTNGDVDIICDNRQRAVDDWNIRADDYK